MIPRKKQWLTLFTLTVLIVSLSVSSVLAVEILHLTNSSHGLGWLNFLEERAAEFNRLHPDIKVDVVQSSGYGNKVTTMIVGGSPPDVTDFAPSSAMVFVRNNTFVDLRSLMEADSSFNADDILEVGYVPVTSPDGAIWALPMDIYPLVSYINLDMLQNAGLTSPTEMLAEDWTWQQALEIAQKTTRIDPSGTAIAYGIDYPDQRWQNFLVQAGGIPYDRMVEPTESRWNTPRVQEGIEWLRGLMVEHKVAPPRGGHSPFRFWKNGSAISLAYGPGMIGGAYEVLGFEYDVVQPPLGPANNGSTFTVNAFQIVESSPNHEAAWEWIKFLTTDDEGMIRFMEITSRTPVLRSVQGVYPTYATTPPRNWMKYYEVAMNPATEPILQNSLSDRINPFVNAMLDNVLRGNEATGPALIELHRQVSAVFAEEK